MPFRQLKSFLKILIGVQYETGNLRKKRYPKWDTPFCMAASCNCAVLPQEILSPRKDTSSPMASSGTAR